MNFGEFTTYSAMVFLAFESVDLLATEFLLSTFCSLLNMNYYATHGVGFSLYEFCEEFCMNFVYSLSQVRIVKNYMQNVSTYLAF